MTFTPQTNVSLSSHSTFGIGGEAEKFFSCKTLSDVRMCFAYARERQIPLLVIGNGSNCLFPDEGISGLVVHNALSSYSEEKNGEVLVDAGYSFSLLGTRTAQEGWSGLEFAAGIPGTLGGALFMNAGAHGQEVSTHLLFVDYLYCDGTMERITKENISFGYRYSSLQEKKGMIVAAGLRLARDEGARERLQEVCAHRKKTQPYRERSAGCVFRNPPGFSAGRLIEEVGLKGTKIGGAEVSSLHANFIVNTDSATASDVKQLIQLVQATVLREKNVALACEVRVL